MENIWFTSDTHFHHANLMNFCRETRLGKDSEEMTELLIEVWNKRIKPSDRVYHMGDVSFGNKNKTLAVLNRLNGNIHLVVGNHDHQLDQPIFDNCFASKQVYKTINVADQRFILMHYPIESWDRMKHGTIHLHGHLHGDSHHECRIIKNRMDVGVDTRLDCDMAPYHLDEVLSHIKATNESLSW